MRTLVDIPDDLLKKVQKAIKQQGISRAEYVRRSLAKSVEADAVAPDISRFFGILADDFEDGQAFQDRMRSEWPD